LFCTLFENTAILLAVSWEKTQQVKHFAYMLSKLSKCPFAGCGSPNQANSLGAASNSKALYT